METFKFFVGIAGYAIEGAGVCIILLGSLAATVRFLYNLYSLELSTLYTTYRNVLGRVILMGLEFLLAGDIIRTVVIETTIEQVGILVVIVLIRTFLSFTLELEVEGRWPWQKNDSL